MSEKSKIIKKPNSNSGVKGVEGVKGVKGVRGLRVIRSKSSWELSTIFYGDTCVNAARQLRSLKISAICGRMNALGLILK